MRILPSAPIPLIPRNGAGHRVAATGYKTCLRAALRADRLPLSTESGPASIAHWRAYTQAHVRAV